MSSEVNLKKLVRIQYDEWAQTYDQDASDWKYSTPRKLAKRLSKYLHKGDLIIDTACGTGLNSLNYNYSKFIFIGIDISLQMLKIAKKRGKYRQLFASDIQKTPFKDSLFDAAILTAALEHYSDINPFVAEIQRIVKPKGIIAFTTACTQIKGLFRHSKKIIEVSLRKLGLKQKESFKILSHYEYGRKPIYFWVVIVSNTK